MIHETARADPDAAVVERIRAGETRLYEVLIRRYNQRLYRVARSLLHEDAEVDDVMQEAYLKAFTALPRFQGKSALLHVADENPHQLRAGAPPKQITQKAGDDTPRGRREAGCEPQRRRGRPEAGAGADRAAARKDHRHASHELQGRVRHAGAGGNERGRNCPAWGSARRTRRCAFTGPSAF